MSRFASETSVPVERSRAEIESVLTKYGAKEFMSGWKEHEAMIAFKIRDFYVRFVLPFPDRNAKEITHKKQRGYLARRTEQQIQNAVDQAMRQRWRALLLVVKAKLEAVECNISTIEHEFLAFIVLPNEMTLGDWIIESKALKQITGGKMPLALEAHEDAEIISIQDRKAQ